MISFGGSMRSARVALNGVSLCKVSKSLEASLIATSLTRWSVRAPCPWEGHCTAMTAYIVGVFS